MEHLRSSAVSCARDVLVSESTLYNQPEQHTIYGRLFVNEVWRQWVGLATERQGFPVHVYISHSNTRF